MTEYFEDPRISQSQLKRFINPNPRSLYRDGGDEEYYYTKEKIYFSKGKLLDLLLMGEDIHKYFYIEEAGYKHPSPAVESIVQQIYDEGIDPELEESFTRINEIRLEHNYQSNYKEDTVKKWIAKTVVPHVSRRKLINGRTILSAEEVTLMATMAQSILEGEYTKPILNEYPAEYQVPLYWTNFKALIDYLQLDHKKKIARIIDFKSTSDYLEKFPKSITKFGYHIQMSFYTHILKMLYPDYTILDPVLIACSTKEPEFAEPFTLSKKVLDKARYGFIDNYGKYYPGWEQLYENLITRDDRLYNKELVERGTNYIDDI